MPDGRYTGCIIRGNAVICLCLPIAQRRYNQGQPVESNPHRFDLRALPLERLEAL